MRSICVLLTTILLTSFSVPIVLPQAPDSSSTSNPTSLFTLDKSLDNLEMQRTEATLPEISVHRSELNFGAAVGGTHTTPQTFMISNSGGGDLNWSASASEPWIQITPSHGTSANTVPVWVSADPTGLATGTYTGTVTITDPNATNSPFVVDILLQVHESDSPPFGTFDTPTNGSTVRSMVPVTGWVLDDVQVSSVQIYRQEGVDLVYIGDATFVEGARPDVEAAYPGYPHNYRAGWGYTLNTYLLPAGGNGTYTLHAIATDSIGQQTTLGTKTVTVDNANAVKPFGDIDTPAPGSIASGPDFVISAWALTPLPNTIPTDGSTIDVFVDGVNLGHPVYNQYRADIAIMFPGYNNSTGAGGYFLLDTTAYDNGIHTVQWIARDDGGNADGIGSRYFTILNPPLPYVVYLPLIMR